VRCDGADIVRVTKEALVADEDLGQLLAQGERAAFHGPPAKAVDALSRAIERRPATTPSSVRRSTHGSIGLRSVSRAPASRANSNALRRSGSPSADIATHTASG